MCPTPLPLSQHSVDTHQSLRSFNPSSLPPQHTTTSLHPYKAFLLYGTLNLFGFILQYVFPLPLMKSIYYTSFTDHTIYLTPSYSSLLCPEHTTVTVQQQHRILSFSSLFLLSSPPCHPFSFSLVVK